MRHRELGKELDQVLFQPEQSNLPDEPRMAIGQNHIMKNWLIPIFHESDIC